MPDTVRQAPIAGDHHQYRHRGSGDSGSSGGSSPAVSPSHSFKRSKSTVYLLDRRTSPPPGRLQQLQPQNVTAATVNGYAALAWTLVKAVFGLPWVHALLVRAPSACLCFWLRLAWSCGARVPLAASGHVLRFWFARRNRGADHRPTVLLNGGSAVQTLHMARNFYAAGARVIVCEIDGRAELCSFSVAVDGYYTVPRPNDDNCVQYVDALRAIVEKERVGYYVPTGTTVSAYYDAVAKSHLELLGCKCRAPGLDGVSVLNDLFEVLCKCEVEGLPVPKRLRVCSKEDIVKLYDNVSFRADRHFIVNIGLSGCKVGHRLPLPAARKSLTLPGPVSDDCPWLVVQNCPGSYYTTCTTVRDGKVLGNVTCSARDRGATQNRLVDDWVTRFVASLPFAFDGILTFRVCVTPSRNVVPLGCRVGLPAEYTSYRSNLERMLLCSPCGVPESPPSPEIEITDRYYATTLLYQIATTQQLTAVQSVRWLVNTLIAKHEMVFAYWDPLPYFAYYNLQLFTDYVRDALDRVSLALTASQKNKYTTF